MCIMLLRIRTYGLVSDLFDLHVRTVHLSSCQSEGLSKDQEVDERRNSQKQLSVPVEKREVKGEYFTYPHPNLSLSLVPYRPFLVSTYAYVRSM